MDSKMLEITRKDYDRVYQREWTRLIRDSYHRLELETTLFFLNKYLTKNSFILDAGSGPGRYTIELAKKGHNLVLLDLSEKNVELAKQKIKEEGVENKVKECIAGSITDLSRFKDNSFDSVLCLGGALSHIHPEKERKKVINELIRISKKNALIFVSVMGRLSIINLSLVVQNKEIKKKHFLDYSLTGDDFYWFGRKRYAHYFLLDELKKLFDTKKVKFITQVGLEGLGSSQISLINELNNNKKAWKNWIAVHQKYCTSPSVADVSNHFMVIYKKL